MLREQYKSLNINHRNTRRENYESGEHVMMADGLSVVDGNNSRRWYIQPISIPGLDSRNKLRTDSGGTYTFGELLALSGDFFWGKDQVSDFRDNISLAKKQFELLQYIEQSIARRSKFFVVRQ